VAVTGGVVERFGSGAVKITMTLAAAVTAGRLVEMTANRTVQHAGAASLKVIGVALQTGSAVGDKIAVATGGIWNLTASGAISAGDQLIAAATGKVSTLAAAGSATLTDINNARAVVGNAVEAIADTAEGPCALSRPAT
jgi:hypothetical protein